MSLTEKGVMTGITNVGEGWHDLVRRLDADLKAIDPDYRLFQVKEKFGGLRYYAEFSEGKATEGEARIRQAEEEADRTCENCGSQDQVTTSAGSGWYIKTLCPTCRKTHEERIAERRAE